MLNKLIFVVLSISWTAVMANVPYAGYTEITPKVYIGDDVEDIMQKAKEDVLSGETPEIEELKTAFNLLNQLIFSPTPDMKKGDSLVEEKALMTKVGQRVNSDVRSRFKLLELKISLMDLAAKKGGEYTKLVEEEARKNLVVNKYDMSESIRVLGIYSIYRFLPEPEKSKQLKWIAENDGEVKFDGHYGRGRTKSNFNSTPLNPDVTQVKLSIPTEYSLKLNFDGFYWTPKALFFTDDEYREYKRERSVWGDNCFYDFKKHQNFGYYSRCSNPLRNQDEQEVTIHINDLQATLDGVKAKMESHRGVAVKLFEEKVTSYIAAEVLRAKENGNAKAEDSVFLAQLFELVTNGKVEPKNTDASKPMGFSEYMQSINQGEIDFKSKIPAFAYDTINASFDLQIEDTLYDLEHAAKSQTVADEKEHRLLVRELARIIQHKFAGLDDINAHLEWLDDRKYVQFNYAIRR